MNINPVIINDEALLNAFNRLPQPYSMIDDEFLENYSSEIQVFKDKFDAQGGIHLIDLGEHQVICRSPTKQVINDAVKRAEKLSPLDADMLLVGPCLLYPSIDVLNGWINGGRIGYPTVIAKRLMKIAAVTIEDTAKKL